MGNFLGVLRISTLTHLGLWRELKQMGLLGLGGTKLK